MEWITLLKAILMLFIIIDAPGNLPIFISLTSNLSAKRKKQIFNYAVLLACVLLLIFALIGQILLYIFKIKLGSFAIAGGLLLVFLSFDIIKGRLREYASKDTIAIVPMATPLLIGPGAITAVLLLIGQNGWIITLIAVLIVIILIKLFFWKTDSIYRLLGKNGSILIARLLGIVIAAIGIEFIISGLRMSGIL